MNEFIPNDLNTFPHLYLHWWFIALAIMLVLISGQIYFGIYTRKLIRYNRALKEHILEHDFTFREGIKEPIPLDRLKDRMIRKVHLGFENSININLRSLSDFLGREEVNQQEKRILNLLQSILFEATIFASKGGRVDISAQDMGDQYHILMQSIPSWEAKHNKTNATPYNSPFSENSFLKKRNAEPRLSYILEETKQLNGEFWVEDLPGYMVVYHFCFPKSILESSAVENMHYNEDDHLNRGQEVQSFETPNQNDEGRQNLGLADAEWLEEVNFLLLNNLSNTHCKVDWLAYSIHLSERQFNRRLKQITGMPPSLYLRELRLQKAKEYLSTRKYSTVKEIAFAVGFTDTAHFSKVFTKRFGVLPSSFFK